MTPKKVQSETFYAFFDKNCTIYKIIIFFIINQNIGFNKLKHTKKTCQLN